MGAGRAYLEGLSAMLERRLRDLSLVSGSVGPRRLRVIWFWLMLIFVLRACVGWLASHCWLSPLCLLSCGPMVAVLGVGRSLPLSPLCSCYGLVVLFAPDRTAIVGLYNMCRVAGRVLCASAELTTLN